VVELPDESSLEQLLDFFTDEILLLNGLLLGLLLHHPGVGVDLQISITSLGIPGICDDCQANTSTLSRRKVMSVSSYLSPRFPMMPVVWAASALIWMTFTGLSSPSEGCT
jgi:hypothetical protein